MYEDSSARCHKATTIFTYKVPKNADGGVYRIHVSHSHFPIPESWELLRIREYHSKRLQVQVDFIKESFLPGEQGEGKLTIRSLDGSPLPDPLIATLDCGQQGVEVQTRVLNFSPVGTFAQALFYFRLSGDYREETLTISFYFPQFEDSHEAFVPVVQEDLLTIDFSPEGGLYAVDKPNVVYFEAFTDPYRSEFASFSHACIIYTNRSTLQNETIACDVGTMRLGKGLITVTP